jgi:mono/diheme cytochrome c family protein
MLVRGMTIAFALVATVSAVQAQTPVERGKYLVNTIMTCQNCHTPKGERGAPIYERDLSGGLEFDEPPFKVTAPNITQDKQTGIGGWTDAQVRTALRTGKRPNGVQLAEVMPTSFYGIVTERDMNAIIAYLKTVKPVANKVPDPIYKIALPHHLFPGGEKPFTESDMADKVKKGFYLVTIGHCMECHTPFGAQGGPDFTGSLGKGGREFPGPWGVSHSRNITSSKEKGIGAWSDAEIKRAITDGVSRDGSRLKPPMGFEFYKNMTNDDLEAVVAYLRTVPPKE